ncbi:hypothetical protein BH23PLA1_BH23PLA1_25430 [soil metagenome]
MTIFTALRKGLAVAAALAALCLMSGGTNTARAESLIPELESIVSNGTDFTWTYSVLLTGNSRLDLTNQTGGPFDNFGVIYDFAGYVANSFTFLTGNGTVATDWALTTQNSGPVPDLVSLPFPDNASIPNLVYEYTNADKVVEGQKEGVLRFTARSIFGGQKLGSYSFQDTKTSPFADDGTRGFGGGTVVVPVPEPASLAMVGLGLIGIPGLMFVQRRRRAANA